MKSKYYKKMLKELVNSDRDINSPSEKDIIYPSEKEFGLILEEIQEILLKEENVVVNTTSIYFRNYQ